MPTATGLLNELYKKVFGTAFSLSRGYSGTHDGIDLAAKEGTAIYAVADGTVEYAKNAAMDTNCKAAWACGGGNVVNINIGNQKATQYAHLSRFVVQSGQTVKRGDLIGYVGHTGNATGAHLHFGLWDKAAGKMIDPTTFLGNIGAAKASGDAFLANLKRLGISTDPDHKLTPEEAEKIAKDFYPGVSGDVLAGIIKTFTGMTVGALKAKTETGGTTSTSPDPLGAAGDAISAFDDIPGAIGEFGKIVGKIAGTFVALALILAGLWLYSKGNQTTVPSINE